VRRSSERSALTRVLVLLVVVAGLMLLMATLVRDRTRSNGVEPEAGTALEPYVRYLPGRLIEGRIAGTLPPETYASLDATSRANRDTLDGLRLGAAWHLFNNKAKEAVSLLSEGRGRWPGEAASWNDLAAAHLARGRDPNDAQSVVEAIDNAAHALKLDPDLPEAWFNLALALEAVQLRDEAKNAWEQAAKRERDPEWEREAEMRHRQSVAAASADEWADWRLRLLDPDDTRAEAALAELPALYLQPARELIEAELLREWGDALIRGREDEAAWRLRRAERIARWAAQDGQDRLLLDAIRTIEAASASVRRTLAHGHLALAKGFEQYERSQREEAEASFECAMALFTTGASPLRWRAELEVGVGRYQRGKYLEAAAIFRSVDALAARQPYAALHGRASWLLALATMQLGDFEGASAAYRTSIKQFTRANELGNVAAANNGLADLMRRIGEQEEGWSSFSRALADLPHVRSPRRRYTMLLNASLYASDANLPYAALVFQDASLEVARKRDVPNTIVEGLTRRAHLLIKAGAFDLAQRDLNEAELWASKILSPGARRDVRAWLDLVHGELQTELTPAAAAEPFERAIASFSQKDEDELPGVRLRAARAARLAGDRDSAKQHLLAGVDTFEHRWRKLRRDRLRASYLDDAWGLYREFILLHIDDTEQAFTFAERGRPKNLDAGIHAPLTPTALSARLPRELTLLYYAVLEDDLLIWAISQDEVFVHRQRMLTSTLRTDVEAYHHLLIDNRNPRPELTSAARRLFTTLIAPVKAHFAPNVPLIIVPDAALYGLSFATLIDPVTGRYLIDDHMVGLVPSATHLLDPPKHARPKDGAASLQPLLIGGDIKNPSHADLDPLPDAAKELLDIAKFYPRYTILPGPEATLHNLRENLQQHNIFHFAGHAIANDRFPWRSELILMPDATNFDGTVSGEQLEHFDLSHLNLVVLSACRTANGPVLQGEGVISLARPFLAKGVPAVVGTLWDVEDPASRALVAEFHKHYAQHQDPLAALQAAQRALLHGSQGMDHPSQWGGFIVIGGAARH